MSQWISTGIRIQDLVNREIRPLSLERNALAIVSVEDQVFVVSAICPHASGDLCQGWLDHRNHIVCPVHSYRFDPKNGRNTSGEEYKLKTYPLEIRDQVIHILI